MNDDELLDALASALRDEAPAEPPPDRVDMLRRLVETATTESPMSDKPNATPGAPVVDLDTRRNRWLGVGRLAIAAAAAVALLIGGALIGATLDRGRDYPATGGELEYAGPITGEAASGELEVVKIGIGRVVSLDTFDLPILPTSEYYEIWFVAADDSPDSPNRISAGTFHPDADGRSEVTFAAAVDPVKYPVVEITAEPGDGDPSPTGPVVMRVQIVE